MVVDIKVTDFVSIHLNDHNSKVIFSARSFKFCVQFVDFYLIFFCQFLAPIFDQIKSAADGAQSQLMEHKIS